MQMDLNHDGVLQFDEFKVGFILFSEMKMKVSSLKCDVFTTDSYRQRHMIQKKNS